MKQNTGCRIFLLSPAYAGGERARMILRDQAQFELARRLRSDKGAPIAEVFTFLSGLYFRGKIAYATAFARPARGTPGVLVITPTRGLIDSQLEFVSMICVSLPQSTFTNSIRATGCQLSETHAASQPDCRPKARSCFLAASPPGNTLTHWWQILASGCDFPRRSSAAVT
jgi:hypothetical protein